MAQLLGPAFGNSSDGVLTVSTPTTDAPIDSACTGTSGTTSLTATNASFGAGKLIMIHQSRGTGAGQWELNKIASYTAGTITTVSPLSYTYASGAQVLVVEQHSGITVSSTLTAKAWNGTVGGIVALMSSGNMSVTGTITATGKGFRGGLGQDGVGQSNVQAYSGEGTTGASAQQTTAKGNGGGGSLEVTPGDGRYGAGGGGGNGAAGSAGGGGEPPGFTVGAAGSTSGAATLATMTFGGGGGGTAVTDDQDAVTTQGDGGAGGGIVAIFANTITVTGSVVSNGNSGVSLIMANQGNIASGGSGGGGSVLVKAKTATLGSSLVTASGGTQGAGTIKGGTGGTGRIRCEACSVTGTTNPTLSNNTGGHSYCGGAAFLI